LDGALDELSGTLFSNLAEQLSTTDHGKDSKIFFDDFVDKSHRFLQSDEKRHRAALSAILHVNLSSGRSYRNTPTSSDQFKFIAKGIRLFEAQGYIRSTVNIELLAEQMIYADAILLELWVTKQIDLERHRLTYKYHIWTLIRAWADETFIGYCDKNILDLQQKLIALESDHNNPSTVSVK